MMNQENVKMNTKPLKSVIEKRKKDDQHIPPIAGTLFGIFLIVAIRERSSAMGATQMHCLAHGSLAGQLSEHTFCLR